MADSKKSDKDKKKKTVSICGYNVPKWLIVLIIVLVLVVVANEVGFFDCMMRTMNSNRLGVVGSNSNSVQSVMDASMANTAQYIDGLMKW